MRALLLLTLSILGVATPATLNAQIAWQQDLQSALRESQSSGRLLLVHFFSDNCVWCDRLEDGAFKDPTVATAIHRDFIPVKIHAGRTPNVARHFGVTQFPTDVVVDHTGLVHGREISPQDPQKYVGMLLASIEHARQTKDMKVAQASAASAQPPSQSSPATPGPTQATLAGHTTPSYAVPPQSMNPASSNTPAESPVAMEGFCPVSLVDNNPPEWRAGDRRWGVVHMGQTYLLATEAAQQKFLENPERYAPVLMGLDVVQFFDHRTMVPGNREFGCKFKERTYLFADQRSYDQFFTDCARYDRLVSQVQERIAMDPANQGLRR